MNFFAVLYALGGIGSLCHTTAQEELFLHEARESTKQCAVIEDCDGVCFPLLERWEVAPNIVWENFHQDLGGKRLTNTQFIEVIAHLDTLRNDISVQSPVTKFVVLTKDEATEDARRDVRYFELKLKNIMGTDQNIQKYLACCGAFQYDEAIPLYVKSSLSMSDSL